MPVLRFMKPLFPQSENFKTNLNCNEQNNNPFESKAMCLTQSFPENARYFLRIIHLLVQKFDADAHIQRSTYLFVVPFQTKFMSAIPEYIG